MVDQPSAPIRLSIGELSARTGCGIETLRYYERIGLLPPPPRSEGRHRLYGAEHLQRVLFIRRARDLDFSLDEVRALLRLAERPEPVGSDVRAITQKHLEVIRQKIAMQRLTEAALAGLLARCIDGAAECPILGALTEGL